MHPPLIGAAQQCAMARHGALAQWRALAHSSALVASAPCIEPTNAILHLQGGVCTGEHA